MNIVSERENALEAEERLVWYATDSLRHTRDLSVYLDDSRTLTINSEMSGEGDAAASALAPLRVDLRHDPSPT